MIYPAGVFELELTPTPRIFYTSRGYIPAHTLASNLGLRAERWFVSTERQHDGEQVYTAELTPLTPAQAQTLALAASCALRSRTPPLAPADRPLIEQAWRDLRASAPPEALIHDTAAHLDELFAWSLLSGATPQPGAEAPEASAPKEPDDSESDTWFAQVRRVQPRKRADVNLGDQGSWAMLTNAWVAAFGRSPEVVLARGFEEFEPGNQVAESILRALLGVTTWQTVRRADLLGRIAAAGWLSDAADDDPNNYSLEGSLVCCGVRCLASTLFPLLVALKGFDLLRLASLSYGPRDRQLDGPTSPNILALSDPGGLRLAAVMRGKLTATPVDVTPDPLPTGDPSPRVRRQRPAS